MRSNSTTIAKALALAFILLLTAGIAFAQDAQIGQGRLTIRPGTFLTVRMNEALSSDRNREGDIFSATLSHPLVVQGIVVADRGQTVAGRVIEARKAGMISGTSRLAIALESLTLADGQNLPIRTQLKVRNGRAAVERDAGTVVGASAAGAIIGAIAGRGRGAAIGAGAGAAAGTLGVLLNRGYPTIVYPESALTFEIVDPVVIDTSYAPQAFRAVNSEDYRAQLPARPVPAEDYAGEVAPPPPVAYPAPYPGPYIYPYPYPYFVYAPYPVYRYRPYYARPFYYGPSVRVVVGRSYYRPYHYRPVYTGRDFGRDHFGGGHPYRPIPHGRGPGHGGGDGHGRGPRIGRR